MRLLNRLPRKIGISQTTYAYFDLMFRNNYRPFVILSQSRTGSTALRSMLGDLPNTNCFGEVFAQRGHGPLYIDPKRVRPKKSSSRWLGFKLFYYHPFSGGDFRSVLESLPSDLLVIHLRRRDLIARGISQFISEQTGAWDKKDAQFDYDSINYAQLLESDLFNRIFQQRLEIEREAVDYLVTSRYQNVELYAEDLNTQATLDLLTSIFSEAVKSRPRAREFDVDLKIPDDLTERLRERLYAL